MIKNKILHVDLDYANDQYDKEQWLLVTSKVSHEIILNGMTGLAIRNKF